MSAHVSHMDETIRLQQAKLFVTLTEESITLRKENAELQQERSRLEERIAQLEKECDGLKAVSGASSQTDLADKEIEMLRLDLNDLKISLAIAEAGKDKATARCASFLEENTNLKEEIEFLRSGSAHERMISIEESNTLRQTFTMQEEVLHAQSLALQQTIDALRTQISTNDATIAQQRHEIERLRHDAIERIGIPGQTFASQSTHRSVSIGVQTCEFPTLSSTKASSTSTGSAIAESEPVNLAIHASRIPARRRELLATFPEIDVVLPSGTEDVYFTKTLLSQILGGSMQGLLVRITGSAKPLAIKWGIDEYLCPKMDHNPWSPTSPGKHGFMQVGLGQDKVRFNKPDIRHIFVGAGGRFKYSGKYEVSRVEALSVAEWKTLPDKVRREYSKTTSIKEKNQNHGTVSAILDKYNDGKLLAPCVLLKCIEFDLEFYDELVAAARGFTSLTAKASTSAGKRKQAAANAEEDGPGETNTPGPKTKRVKKSAPKPSAPAGKTRRKSIRLAISTRPPSVRAIDAEDVESVLSSSPELESDWDPESD